MFIIIIIIIKPVVKQEWTAIWLDLASACEQRADTAVHGVVCKQSSDGRTAAICH